MNKIIRLLVGVAMATALVGAASGTEPLAAPAEAAPTSVSKTYTAPKKGQTNAGVKALQQRLVTEPGATERPRAGATVGCRHAD